MGWGHARMHRPRALGDTRLSSVPHARPARQPIFNVPAVVTALLGVLLATHLVRQGLSDDLDAQIYNHLAFVPGRLTAVFDRSGIAEAVAALPGADPDGFDRRGLADFFLASGAQPWTLVTYALLHGSWTHVGFNCVWLLAFGTPVARRFGAPRFLLFMAAGAAAGALTQEALFPFDFDPLVGISAAVSGCMGAALRFVFRPSDEPPPAFLPPPAVPWRALMRDRRVTGFLAAWFVTNLATGLGPVAAALAGAPIAWQAHIGGFLLGFAGFRAFDPAGTPVPPPPPEADVASDMA